jgi:hypothetical protein
MARKYDMKKWGEGLKKRTEESNERKEGDTFLKFFRDDKDIPFVKFGATKDEPHIIDIIPFEAGDNMPKPMRVPEGEPAYYLDVYVHQGIGAGNAQVICLQKNYNKPCPICEYINKMIKDKGWEYEQYRDIAAKRRSVYNIVNVTNAKEEKKGVQVWETSHKYGEKAIQSAATRPRGGGVIPFADPRKDVGQSISFNVDSDEYKTVSGHKLEPRDYDIDEKYLDAAFQLDQLIAILDYDRIKEIFDMSSEDEDSSFVSQDKEESKKSDKEEAPKGRSRNKSEEDVPKNDPLEDECPEGLSFGEDIDSSDSCATCKNYDACADKEKEIKEQKRKDREERRGGRR